VRFSDIMSLTHKVKTALDENRLLILGAQVLFGFQLQGVFQEEFAALPDFDRELDAIALGLLALTLALLIAPSMQHRIVEAGADTVRIHGVAGLFAGAALLPLGVSLGLDIFIVFDHLFGASVAMVAGGFFCGLAALLWYGIGLVLRYSLKVAPMHEAEKPTPLSTQIEQLLTEARVIVPGGQALLGFQLVVTFTRAFGELPTALRMLHVAALCCVALAVVLLMTPAALHRTAFRGQDTQDFLYLGSAFVLAAPAALALGLAADMDVAIAKATGAEEWAMVVSGISLMVLIGLWYVMPLMLRLHRSRRPAWRARRSSPSRP
jgi:hypothetical protein